MTSPQFGKNLGANDPRNGHRSSTVNVPEDAKAPLAIDPITGQMQLNVAAPFIIQNGKLALDLVRLRLMIAEGS